MPNVEPVFPQDGILWHEWNDQTAQLIQERGRPVLLFVSDPDPMVAPFLREILRAMPGDKKLCQLLADVYYGVMLQADSIPEYFKALGAGSSYHIAILSPAGLTPMGTIDPTGGTPQEVVAEITKILLGLLKVYGPGPERAEMVGSDGGREDAAPKFWTADFHLRYFPRRVLANLRKHPDGRKGHILIEIPLAVAFCGVLIAIGLSSAIDKHSPGGWILAGLGSAGLLALIVFCWRSTAGWALSYFEFEPWTFLFLTLLGLSGGLAAGMLTEAPWLPWLTIPAGAGLGYFLGIGAGLGAQRLGPLRVFVALASGFGTLVTVITFFIYFLYIKK